MEPENAGGNQAKGARGRFRKGQSGNPRGKPPGARHATTIKAEQLMEGEAEAVVRAVVAKAKRGDMHAARLVLDRIAPLRRGRPVAIKLPEVRTAAEASPALGIVTKSMANGEITPEEASAVAAVIEANWRALGIEDLERRINALEARTE
jgi:hypothetical protein